ncbi:hypothetical protein AC629_22780 [Bradyrhizobium sp. NAS80.1]|uniref:hypothetical protein n=1 Tax=Bradyrhizobium sp. NAS80.1 TaxID=1680159 RepID=UPI000965D7E4|nr:hypothetical protein [Bradyrhizobium sp. NAS80.1]OKO83371.1 hypothetical protein AC629_22780 [Bradyrhizobium sp. NAS80.1]
MSVSVDLTITLGTIIETSVLAFGGITALVTLRNTVSTLKTQMETSKQETKEQMEASKRENKEQFAGIQSELKKMGEILIDMARFEERFTNLDRRVTAHGRQIDELRHGDGFVRNHTAADPGINREY